MVYFMIWTLATCNMHNISVYYLSVRCAGIAPPESMITARVLQTETGLMSLSYFKSCHHVQQVVVTKGIHAVVMPKEVGQIKKNRILFILVGFL